MFLDFKIVLDPPPHGAYTFEDIVSGKIVLESAHDEKIGWVYVFFYGWVNVEVVMVGTTYAGSGNNPQKWSDKTKDKEILFQNHLKVYQGDQKLRKHQRYEWPFTFSFQAETNSAASLPTSGHYSFSNDRTWWSSVQYKVVAVHGDIGQTDDHIRWMLNPTDPRYLKEPSLKPTGILLKLREKMGGAAEQELKFVQIRSSAAIDPYMTPPHKWDLNIAGHHVPQIAPPYMYEDLRVQRTTFPFSIDLQIPANIVIGQQFMLLLSVSSISNIWNQNPPPVTVTSFKIESYLLDIITIGEQRGDEKLKVRPIWEGKRLNIPLSSEPVDMGKIYSFSIADEDIIQSFDTQLLHRAYSFPVQLTVEVGGKSFETRYSNSRVTVLSPNVAMGSSNVMFQTQPQDDYGPDFKQKSKLQFSPRPIKVQLQSSYIGRVTHDGAGLDRPVSEHSIMEAVIALSTTLTEAGVQHSFLGGTLIKLHSYIPSQSSDYKISGRQGTDGEKLRDLFKKSFRVNEVDEPFVTALHLGFTDPKHGENITIEFPDLLNVSDYPQEKFSETKKGDSYAVNLTPVILFNYRLWCLATHERFGEPEIDDIEPLFRAFRHDLQVHRREVNVQFAKVALRKHPMLANILTMIGCDLERRKGDEVQSGVVDEEGEEELPPYDPGWGRNYERDLAHGLEDVSLGGQGAAPGYEAGSSKFSFSDKK